jgi:Restriction endonuclease
MSYNFSRSEVISAEISSLTPPQKRGPFESFQRTYGADIALQFCPFCTETPQRFYSEHNYPNDAGCYRTVQLVLCPKCLWFRAACYFNNNDLQAFDTHYYAAYRECTSGVSSLPLVALETHLARQWKDTREMTPAQAEDLVAHVFADHLSCEVHYVTNGVFAPDGGIDFVLIESGSGIEYAFQVKRRLTDKSERIRPIREFIGSMTLRGYDRGFFVTFAQRLTGAAHRELREGRQNVGEKTIEVVDGGRLYGLIRNFRAAHLRGHPLLQPDFQNDLGLSAINQEWHRVPLDANAVYVKDKLVVGPALSVGEVLASL